MDEVVLSNAVKGAIGALDNEPLKLNIPMPREIIENDALAVALAGGNAQDLVLRQVMNDLGPRPPAKPIDLKDSGPEITAAIWSALPPVLAGQDVETGAPTSLWCKDGH